MISKIKSVRKISVLFYVVMISTVAFSQKKPLQINKLVLKNVNIITMTASNTIIKNATVVITDNYIESINGNIPKDGKVIDGKGKWLIPGLIDMHVHLNTDLYFGQKKPGQKPDLIFNTQDVMTPIIANGVTTVLDLNATQETFGQKKEIEKGYVVGPRLALAALINGGSGQGRIANTADEARTIVKTIKAEGYDFIKLYSKLNVETYSAIIDEASKLGLKTIGHIPNDFIGKLEKAFIPNFGMIAHAEELSKHSETLSLDDAKRFAKLAKDNGTWLAPTLTTMVWIANQTHSVDSIKNSPALKYVHPLFQSKWLTANNYVKNATPENTVYLDSMVKFHFNLVKIFKEAGVPIVTGTDAGVSGVINGFALHDELELLVKASLTPQEALISATRLPAEWLGIDNQIGTIETGKLADLVLLDENPLINIGNTRKIAGVIINGNWVDKSKIRVLLSELATRNTAAKDKFNWKDMMNKRTNK